MRDSRAAIIYESTNEIQGQDQLFRKVLSDEGGVLGALLKGPQADLQGATMHRRNACKKV